MLFLVTLLISAFLFTDASEAPSPKSLAFDIANILKTTELSIKEITPKLAIQAAGELLKDLLNEPTTKGSNILQPIENLWQVGGTSSKNGIACHIHVSANPFNIAINKLQYYHIKNSTLMASDVSLELPDLAHKSAMLHCGVSSDDQYLYALYTTEIQSPGRDFYTKLTFALYNIQTKKVKNINLDFDPTDIKSSSIAYNEKTQEFLLFFPCYIQTRGIVVFCKFSADNPIIRTINNNQIRNQLKMNSSIFWIATPMQWQFIDDSIVAIISGKYFIYEPYEDYIISHNMLYNAASKTITYAYALDEKKTPPLIMLKSKKINLGEGLPIEIVCLASFIPNYQEILNNKIMAMEPSFTAKSPDLSFDPSRLRYLGYYQYGLFTGYVSIVDIFSQTLVNALKIINQKWQLSIKPDGAPYENILYDAWYIYHAEKQTGQFLNLQENSPMLAQVSPELIKIYPLLTASQKVEVSKITFNRR